MFSRSTVYALRAVLLLAGSPGEPRYAADIAAELEVPANFLSKLLGHLRKRGILLSKKGRGGGFQLATTPDEITLGSIVDEFEQRGSETICMLGLGKCSDVTKCPLHERWERIYKLVDEMLDETTLAVLTTP